MPVTQLPPHRRAGAQALVELALVLPVILVLVMGTIGVSRVIRVHMALDEVAREAARTATLAPLPPAGSVAQAEQLGRDRGQLVAAGYGLQGVDIKVNAQGLSQGSWVRADVGYTVSERDVPFMKWVRFKLSGDHTERVDRYRDPT